MNFKIHFIFFHFSVHLKVVVSVFPWTSIFVLMLEFILVIGHMFVHLMGATRNLPNQLTSSPTFLLTLKQSKSFK